MTNVNTHAHTHTLIVGLYTSATLQSHICSAAIMCVNFYYCLQHMRTALLCNSVLLPTEIHTSVDL